MSICRDILKYLINIFIFAFMEVKNEPFEFLVVPGTRGKQRKRERVGVYIQKVLGDSLTDLKGLSCGSTWHCKVGRYRFEKMQQLHPGSVNFVLKLPRH